MEAAGMEGNCLSTVFLKHFFELLSDPIASFAEKMKLALEKKDSDLAAAQKEAQDKTALADQKLASVEALEGEVTKLKSCLNESNREVSRLKKDKITLNEKLESAVHKRNDTEAYLRTPSKKLYLMLEGTPFKPTVLTFANESCSVDSLIFYCRILPRL